MVDGVNLFELKSLKAVAKWHSNEFVVVIYCEFEYKSFYHESDQMRYAQLTIRIGFSQRACILLCTRLPAAGLWANFYVKPFICPGWIMTQAIRGVGGKFLALWPPPIVVGWQTLVEVFSQSGCAL